MTTSEQCKIVKKALAARYGMKNVSVTKGSGTVCMWIHAYITVDTLADRLNVSTTARKLATEALKDAGAEISTYTADDGYDSENDCLLIQVRHRV